MNRRFTRGEPISHTVLCSSILVCKCLSLPWQKNATVTTDVVHVRGTWAEELAKQESQQTTIITKQDIAKKQAKSVEDIVFTETGVSRTVDAMGACRCIYSGGRSTTYIDSR